MKPQLICLAVIFLLTDCSSVKKRTGNGFNSKPDTFNSESPVGPQADGSYVVSTSQIIDPAGETVVFPGRPVDFALNSDETILAVKNMQNVVFFNVKERKIIASLKYPKGGSSFNGICWDDAESKIWVSDSRGFLRSIKMRDGSFAWDDEIKLPGYDNGNPYPGGIAIDQDKLYVALNRNNTLGMFDLVTKKLEKEVPVGVAPYAVELYRDKAYVTNWGGRHPASGEISHSSSGTSVLIDEKTGVASSGTVSVISIPGGRLVKEIGTKLHPSGMCFSADSTLLYVANANSDAVSVIDTKIDSVIETFSSKPDGDLPFGSAPNDLCASRDGKTLYISNGGDNLISVFDLSRHKITGLIPAGWYPGSVIVTKDGKTLITGNMKGIGSRQEVREHGRNTHDQTGSVSFIDVPGEDSLKAYTERAATNMRLPRINLEMKLAEGSEKLVPVPVRPGEKSFFKHVIYIIKENRTYDQVLGDMPSGNGDSSLCIFGKKYTPNQHKIAAEFVLLDNTYCNGVLSAEGHNWTSQGYATDYLERSFPDWVRGYPWNGDDPLVYSPAGFIWDYVKKAGLKFRTYGEFVKDEVIPENSTWTDLYRDYKSGSHRIKIKAIPTIHTLEDSYCPEYTGSPRTINDQYKADVFIRELHDFEKNGNFPNLMMLSLPNNHTSGTQEGFPVPTSMVADNDLALGRIVEAVSKSKYWKETAIFVIEDDPQNGLDHIDGHRTTAFCISPYTKRGSVISTHYNQNSILRTIELILGLPPMTQFDLIAYPMSDCFTSTPDLTPYEALPNNVPLDLMNPELSSITGEQLKWAKKSMALNLMGNDDLEYEEEITLNKILWHSVKGYDVPYPDSY
ncbi:MAG TPA: alkaline phosphatase family protein [Bacteroidales bacterium]|nr:alkaline phosphatase family protein [Bacteroidales bacterium]